VAFICSNFMVERSDFNAEDSLVDQGVIDSIGLIEISAFMEEEFDMTVDEKDMDRINFGSLKKMVGFIVRRNSR
jgi:acyl carrier protein